MKSEVNENKINVDYYSERDEKDYTNFLLNNPDSNIYHTIEWKEVLEESYNIKPLYLIARNDEGQIRAILPMFFIKSLIGKRLDSLPLSIYGGVLGDEKYIKPLFEKIFEMKNEMNCNCVVFRQLPGYDNYFDKVNFKKIENKWNQCVELKDPEILWKEIKKPNRNRIRKARKDNIITERIERQDYLKSIYRMEVLIWRRIGTPIPPLSFIEKIWNKMHSKGLVEVFIAKHADKVIASTLIFPFNKRVICRIANSDIRLKQPGVNNLLLWDAIVWSYNKGYGFFDLGATDKDNPGLFFFKSTFKTIDSPLNFYYYPSNTIRIADEVLFKGSKKIIQKMPAKLFEKIGPYLGRLFF